MRLHLAIRQAENILEIDKERKKFTLRSLRLHLAIRRPDIILEIDKERKKVVFVALIGLVSSVSLQLHFIMERLLRPQTLAVFNFIESQIEEVRRRLRNMPGR